MELDYNDFFEQLKKERQAKCLGELPVEDFIDALEAATPEEIEAAVKGRKPLPAADSVKGSVLNEGE